MRSAIFDDAMRTLLRALAAGSLLFIGVARIACAQTTTQATPAPSASPPVTIGEDFSIYAMKGGADLSNALLNLNAASGRFRLSASAGGYNFPTVGFPFAGTFDTGVNTQLYTALPVAALQYNANDHVSLAVGKFASLLGQESPFTFQNMNIQRGLAWSMEPTISRGVRGAYTNAKITATLEEDDAYYSGSSRAFQGLLGYTFSPNTSAQFAAILPGRDVGPNPTTTVGNKREYDLMLTEQIGKLQLLPYYLWVNSPSSHPLGYTRDERATAAVLMGVYQWSAPFALAFRYESVRNASDPSDSSANADLVGFGPGSHATTLTLTPTYKFGNEILRLELSQVRGSVDQTRAGFEIGVFK